MEIGNVIWTERITREELNGYWAKLERLILKEGEQSLKSVQYSQEPSRECVIVST